MPLWAATLPFALTLGLLTRTNGFTVLEAVGMSTIVFSGGAQVALVTLVAAGTSPLAIIITILALNVRHILYGLSLRKQFPPLSLRQILYLAFFLTDESYGLTIRDGLSGRGGPGFYLGAGISIGSIFNIGTLVGALVGQLLPDTTRFGLDFIFPLTFLALLIPLIFNWRQIVVAITAGLASLIFSNYLSGGVAILLSALLAATVGILLEQVVRQRQVD